MNQQVYFPVGNYYGTPYVMYNVEESKYFMCIDDHSGEDKVEISKEFYLACKREFEEG